MIVDSDRTFPSESPVCAYWLTRCEGFTVRSESRVLGVVESVAGDGLVLPRLAEFGDFGGHAVGTGS